MQVWDWGGNGFVRYHASDVGREVIGYVAENLVLHTAFIRQLSRPGRMPVFQTPVSHPSHQNSCRKSPTLVTASPMLHLKPRTCLELQSLVLLNPQGWVQLLNSAKAMVDSSCAASRHVRLGIMWECCWWMLKPMTNSDADRNVSAGNFEVTQAS